MNACWHICMYVNTYTNGKTYKNSSETFRVLMITKAVLNLLTYRNALTSLKCRNEYSIYHAKWTMVNNKNDSNKYIFISNL